MDMKYHALFGLPAPSVGDASSRTSTTTYVDLQIGPDAK